MSTGECSVSAQTTADALGNEIIMSPTSFEKYVKCPFSYFCSDVLSLREKKDSVFKANNMGLFIHYILEKLVQYAIPQTPEDSVPDDDTLIKMANDAAETYIKRICPPSLIDSKRLAHLYSRLKKLALIVVKSTVKEFSHSEFKPVFYELRADGNNGNPPAKIFKIDEECKVKFKGVIDRVDLYRSGDEVYIRVVDYKTGSKVFSINDVEAGINIQMLVYLLTLCRSDSAEFKRSIGIGEGKNGLPAGVMYLSSNIAVLEASDYGEEEKIADKAELSLSRTGILLNDEHVLRAMNDELDSKFLANIKAKTDKENNLLLSGNALTTGDEFKDIFKNLEETIIKIATELHSGKADANPLVHDKKSPCDYCRAKPSCRKRK